MDILINDITLTQEQVCYVKDKVDFILSNLSKDNINIGLLKTILRECENNINQIVFREV